MPDRLTCDSVSASDLVARYVGGRASEEESEALELHVLECEACAADLKAAVELRAVFTGSTTTAAGSSGDSKVLRRSGWMIGLAVAATLLLAVGIVWERNRPRQAETILRGPDDGLVPAFGWQSDGSLRLTWQEQPGAAIYRVRLSGPAGEPVTEQVSVPSATISASIMARLPEASVEVEAENAAGEVLARSAVTRIPRR